MSERGWSDWKRRFAWTPRFLCLDGVWTGPFWLVGYDERVRDFVGVGGWFTDREHRRG